MKVEAPDTPNEDHNKQVEWQDLLQEQVSNVHSMESSPQPSIQGESLENSSENNTNSPDFVTRVPNRDCVSLCGRILRIMGDEQTCRTCGKHLKTMGDEIYLNYATRSLVTQLLNLITHDED